MKSSLLNAGIIAAGLALGVSGTSLAQSPPASQHSMTGEVTKVDTKRGWIDVKTKEGSMKLHFPPSAVSNLKKGDNVTVDIGMSTVASADMKKGADMKKSGSPDMKKSN
jgi:hypothetical protein